MVHAVYQVILKVNSCTLQMKKGMNHYGFPHRIFTKLLAYNCPYILCDRRYDVGILNVCYFTGNSFRAANVREILTVSLNTMLVYVMVTGGFVTCPCATKFALRLKSYILTNKYYEILHAGIKLAQFTHYLTS